MDYVELRMIHSDGIHVVSDTSFEELHRWAERHNIGHHFFHRGRWPHYDIPKRKRDVVFADVNQTTSRNLLNTMRNGPILEELIAEDRSRIGLTEAGLTYRGPVTR